MIKISTLMKILSFFVLGKVYLVIVFENLPFPLSSYYFFSLAWFSSLALFNTKIFFSRSIVYVYVFIALIYFLMFTGIYEADYKRVFDVAILPLFLALSIYEFYLSRKDYKGLGLLIGATVLFIIVTAITTSIGVSVNPLAARQLGGSLHRLGEYGLIEQYQRMGIASFGFVAGIAFTMPVLIGIAKQKWHNLTYKFLFVIGIIILVFSFMRFQYTMALLFGLFGLILALVSIKYRTISIIIITIILFSLLIMSPSNYLAPLFSFADYAGSHRLQERILDLQVFLETGEIGRDSGTHVGGKMGRIPILIDSIKENPFFGTGFSSGHNFWLDWISRYGFIGFIPWILLIWQQVRLNLKRFDHDFRYYYLLSMASYILFGFINNMGGSQMIIMVYLIIPGLYYFKEMVILKKDKKDDEITLARSS